MSHFTVEELERSNYAVRFGIDNTIPPELLHNAAQLITSLERVRTLLGVPVTVLSGYRCQALNRAVGGAPNSQHMNALAADIVAPGYGGPKAICRAIEAKRLSIAFDQLIYEGNWVHISFSDTPRYEVLAAHFKDGKAAYAKGIA